MSKISRKATNDLCPQTLFIYGTYKEDMTPDLGLFCWFSYFWDNELGVMMCIGGEKLTKDRIKAGNVFSANLVTEKLLPLADYLGNRSGYDVDKMDIKVNIEKGAALNVPVLTDSPVNFELEVFGSVPMSDGEVFLCRIRNVLYDEELADAIIPAGERIEGDIHDSLSLEEMLNRIAPVSTTCSTYFSWSGKRLGAWGEAGKRYAEEKGK
ncbi:MAG: flavin reductase [Ruminococcus sp.]|nr:flavin reductase [Ruminococcus sp.]